MPYHKYRLFLSIPLFTVIWFIAACGAPPNASTSTPPATPGSAALNGCPTQQAPPDATSKPADVVANEIANANGQPVTLKVGQILEVRLSAPKRWGLSLQDSSQILQPDATEGWYNAMLRDCIWRFTAKSAGTASLIYAGGPVCAANTKCPDFVEAQEFDVTVRK